LNTPTIPVSSTAAPRAGLTGAAKGRPLRVAMICNFLEERWPSMDLVGDMLCSHLAANCDNQVTVTQIRPAFKNRCTRVFEKPAFRNADLILNRFADYPAWLRPRAGEYDLFHLVDHSYSQLLHILPAGRTVVTCHDLDTFRCVLEPERDQRPRWFRAMSRRILDGFRNAAHVIAVSEATRDELLRHRLVSPERISVVPNGVDPICSPQADGPADLAATGLLPAPAGTPWLLSVGSTAPRKRLDVLLRVFAAVKRVMPEAGLVRVGGLSPELEQLATELNIRPAIVTLPFLARDLLAAIYRRAALLLQTSDAEGFGLPVVEAMASGCPVAASDIPALREIGGTAVTYCPVADVAFWQDAVVRLLREREQQPEAWARRRHHAVAHAEHFSWAENARQAAVIYHQVYAAVAR